MEDFKIPVFVINLAERTDRLEHIQNQFSGRHEFDVRIIKASEHKIGAIGLWNSIRRITRLAIESDEDVIIMCEDDHEFTKSYNREKFINDIFEAHRLGANLLLGGILGGYNNMIILQNDLCWIDSFWGTQFVVIFRPFFRKILDERFSAGDVADGKFSEMTSNKLLVTPMISTQKEFGYSDIADINSLHGHIGQVTLATVERIEKMHAKINQFSYTVKNT